MRALFRGCLVDKFLIHARNVQITFESLKFLTWPDTLYERNPHAISLNGSTEDKIFKIYAT